MRQLAARLSPEHATFIVAFVLTALGLQLPTSRYLSPESGLGYALGILGGSMMLLLLVYPARKRFRVLAFLGPVPHWFRVHMILGVAGPVCILFHSGFDLGATNSNVALGSMLGVTASGFIGRYFYAKIHQGLFGRKATLAELHARAQQLKAQNPALPMLPDLIHRIEVEERALLDASRSTLAPLRMAFQASGARRRLRHYTHTTLSAAAAQSSTLAAQRPRIARAVNEYASRRLAATRRVAELAVYERLFSLWHVAHLPLFLMLLGAGIVHVIAVHLY